ncbi:MAG TPA: lasso peptide isopeptide bond-forming cyclase [Gemmatimonadaceae bacterium]|jgi:asparagine synthase (glutamine-hydrolysing)
MSAICGIFHLDGQPAARDKIAAMSAALAHRGPDRDGLWSGNDVAVAHRLLVTTLESVTEVQPVVRSPGQFVLVADARIDNRDELLSTLRPSLSYRASDSEIILAAYERWGCECVDRLIGDFAFAIWDSRADTLFCARDPMGVKPFYYFRNDRVFAFATELKSLFTLADVTPTIDPDEVSLFMSGRHEERTRTMYRDLMRLPAAHTMVVTRDRVIVRRFWSPESAADVRYRTDEEFAEAFRDIFARAVSARSRCAKAIGATLSGGLDSSSVVCMARHLRSRTAPPLQTFSVIFPTLPERELRLIDERSFVDSVVQSGGVRPHFVRGDQISPLRDLRKIIWHLDEPYFAPNLYLHWGMYEAAGETGVRVLLDGFDGDSAVGHGFGRLTGLARARQWDALEAELLAFSAHHGKSAQRAVDNYVLPHLEDLAREGHYVSWLEAARNVGRRFGLSRANLALTRGIRPMLSRSLGRARPAIRSEREAHVEGLSQPLYQLTLEIADKSAAAFGVEPRYPFFDRRLIEFCVGLPEEQKFGGGWPRLLFRRAMNGVLPPAIQWRTTKSNLSPNFHRQFRAVDASMSEMLDEAALAPYVRIDRLCALRSQYQAANAQDARNAQDLTLFRTIVLGEWLSQFADRSHRARSDVGALSPEAA